MTRAIGRLWCLRRALGPGLALALTGLDTSGTHCKILQGPGSQETARIAGHVVQAATGKAVGAATLLLVPWPGAGMQRRAAADAQGFFEFRDLPAGSYRLTAMADLYVAADYGQTQPVSGSSLSVPGKPIDLKGGDNFDKADVRLWHTSAVEGQLLDEFGDPAPGVQLQVGQVMVAAGRTRMMPVPGRGFAVTDDKGQFRAPGLPPGNYYLLALSGPFADQPPTEPSLPARAGFAPTYFPGTRLSTEAQPVHVSVGNDVRGITFQLVPAPLFSVTGRVVDTAGHPVGPVKLTMYQTQGGDIRAFVPANLNVGSDGAFTYRNVPTGNYVIQAFGPTGFASLSVEVAQDVMDLALKLQRPTTARGHVTFDGPSQQPSQSLVRITLRPTEFVSGGQISGGLRPFDLKDDGTFEISALSSIGVLRQVGDPSWALKSVTVNGSDITDAPFDFRLKDVEGIEVVLTRHTGSVAGTVQGEKELSTDYSVLVFSENRAKWSFPSRFVVLARPNQEGKFNVAGLLPGNYLAVALEELLGTEQDPAFLEALRTIATPVTVEDGNTVRLALKLIRR